MSINYASMLLFNLELRKHSRRPSVNENFSNYHKIQQEKSFTESYPVSLQRQKKQNQLSLVEFDENPVDLKHHPFTFQDKMEQKTEVTKKKFVFDTQPSNKNECKNVLAAMDDYIDFMNESSDTFTMSSENNSKLEISLFQRLHVIRQKHEELLRKYKELSNGYKQQRYQNHQLKQQLAQLQKEQQDDTNEKLKLAQQNIKLKQKCKDLQMKSDFLQNQFFKEKLRNDIANNKLMLKRIEQQEHHEQYESLETQSQQVTHETHETEDDNQLNQFLKSQLRKIKQNNKQIDRLQIDSRLFSKKFSDHNATNEEF